jgi:hypothetical protein
MRFTTGFYHHALPNIYKTAYKHLPVNNNAVNECLFKFGNRSKQLDTENAVRYFYSSGAHPIGQVNTRTPLDHHDDPIDLGHSCPE